MLATGTVCGESLGGGGGMDFDIDVALWGPPDWSASELLGDGNADSNAPGENLEWELDA